MAFLTELKTEIDADPLTRGYAGMTDQQVADDLNTAYRSAEGGVGGMLQYCVKNRSRTNNGTDTTPLPLIGRLQLVADAAVGTDPFGTTVAANEVTLEMKAWAYTFLILMQQGGDSFGLSLDFVDTEVDAGYTALGPGAGVVWKNPDIDALKALSQNQQSRALELGWGKVNASNVKGARAL